MDKYLVTLWPEDEPKPECEERVNTLQSAMTLIAEWTDEDPEQLCFKPTSGMMEAFPDGRYCGQLTCKIPGGHCNITWTDYSPNEEA